MLQCNCKLFSSVSRYSIKRSQQNRNEDLIKLLLGYFDVSSVSVNENDIQISYRGPMEIHLGQESPLPEKLLPFMNSIDAEKIFKKIVKLLYEEKIISTAELLRKCSDEGFVFEESNLIGSIGIDLLYEMLQREQNGNIIGCAEKATFEQWTIDDMRYIPKTIRQEFGKILPNDEIDKENYYHRVASNAQDEGDINVQDCKIEFSSKNDTFQNIFDGYIQVMRALLKPNEKLEMVYKELGEYSYLTKARSRNRMTDKKHLALYSQMSFLFLGEWYNKYVLSEKNSRRYLYSTQTLYNEDGVIGYYNDFSAKRMPHVNIDKNILENDIFNPKKVFPLDNRNGNLSVSDKRTLQRMMICYYIAVIESFRQSARNYFLRVMGIDKINSSYDKIWSDFAIHLFRFNYVLRHSVLFNAYHYDKIRTLNSEKKLSVPLDIPISFFSLTLVYYLSKSKIDLSNEDVIAEFNKYDSYIKEELDDEEIKYGEHIEDVFVNKLKEYEALVVSEPWFNYDDNMNALPYHLLNNVLEWLNGLLETTDDMDENWKRVDKMIRAYYKFSMQSGKS